MYHFPCLNHFYLEDGNVVLLFPKHWNEGDRIGCFEVRNKENKYDSYFMMIEMQSCLLLNLSDRV
jgi:hypothetical protein